VVLDLATPTADKTLFKCNLPRIRLTGSVTIEGSVCILTGASESWLSVLQLAAQTSAKQGIDGASR